MTQGKSMTENDEAVQSMLTTILADSMMLYSKTKEIHWTAKGTNFMGLQELFEGQCSKLQEAIDEINLLKKELGISKPDTVKSYLQYSCLNTSTEKYKDKNEMLKELLLDHQAVIKALNKNISCCEKKCNDSSIADFFRYQLHKHLTIAFALRKYLMNERKMVN